MDAYDDLAKREAELMELNKAINMQSELILQEEELVSRQQSSSAQRPSSKSALKGPDDPENISRYGPDTTTGQEVGPSLSARPRSSRLPRGPSSGGGGGAAAAARRAAGAAGPAAVGGRRGSGGGGGGGGGSVAKGPPPAPARAGGDRAAPPPLPADDITEEELTSLGPEGTIRFQRARIKVLESQLKEFSEQCLELERAANEARAESKNHLAEKKKISKELQAALLESKKQAKVQAKEEGAKGNLEQQLSIAKEELRSTSKSLREAEDKNKKLELRLNRAVEEAARHRSAAEAARGEARERGRDQNRSARGLEARCQRLERQKTELLNAFKKQMKLIDVLNRQKVHIEAAKLLSFTEDEFMRILDWGAGGGGGGAL